MSTDEKGEFGTDLPKVDGHIQIDSPINGLNFRLAVHSGKVQVWEVICSGKETI